VVQPFLLHELKPQAHLSLTRASPSAGLIFEVYREQGRWLSWSRFIRSASKSSYASAGVPAIAQPRLQLDYKGTPLKSEYIPDFICYDKIIIELKAVKELTDAHRAQVQNYLKATGFKLAFLVNFCHHPLIEIERIVL
jgi:GxxExxY protein